VVRDYLDAYAAGSSERLARARLLVLSDRLDAGSGGGRRWTRDELYEDRPGGRP
jgi:hypothetical protein